MPFINVDGKKMYLSDEDHAFLNIYKGANDEEKLKIVFDDKFSYVKSLSYENLNKFLNFLSNPNVDLLNDVDFSETSKMIDMTVSLINIAGKYSSTFGPIKRVLYRTENIANLSGYESGELTSMKSTSSRDDIAKKHFNYPNSEQIVYKVYGYCPYICVEKCLGTMVNGNEAEYLFPPFIKCKIKDEKYFSKNGYTFNKIIEIEDDFSTEEINDKIVTDEELDIIIDKFKQMVIFDKNNGKISEETKILADIINSNLRAYARYKYNTYKGLYEIEKRDSAVKIYNVTTGEDTYNNIHLTWDDKHRGFEDALIQYFQEPDRNWTHSDTVHVYTLSNMVDNGLIDTKLLEELYGNSDCKEMDSFFLTGNYKISNEDYSKFLDSFNIMAGYGIHGKDEILEVKQKMSNLAVDILYDNKDYENLNGKKTK